MAGDNGGRIQGEQVRVLTIYIDKVTQRVSLEGLIGQKTLCFNVLAEAIKTVANFDPSKVQPVVRPGFIAGVRNFLTRRH